MLQKPGARVNKALAPPLTVPVDLTHELKVHPGILHPLLDNVLWHLRMADVLVPLTEVRARRSADNQVGVLLGDHGPCKFSVTSFAKVPW